MRVQQHRSTSTSDAAIALGWCGPDENGVVRLARQIALAAGDLGFTGPVVTEPDPARASDLAARLPAGVRLLHLHLSDWLFADAAAEPDAALTGLLRCLQRRGVALTITLHDLPQPTDGSQLYRRRAGTYRLLVESAVAVAVCSDHERQLLAEALLTEGTIHADAERAVVLPLPIDAAADSVGHPPPGSARTVGIFGYIYPGKGHREVLEELTQCRPPVSVLAIGRSSDRHHDLVDELMRTATAKGMSFRCTGYVPDSDVLERLRGDLIPVAPHTHVSASGSINSWIAAGRRPLVPAGRYPTELLQRMPGAVRTYQPGRLRSAVESAVEDAALTWLPPGLAVGPSTRSVAGRYLNWLREIAGDL